MDIVGSRWWKFDFHTHTPASMDYGKGDRELKDIITPEAWLMEYINNGVECVAVTDHNSGEWIDRLKEAAENLSLVGHNIVVFPGVEITASGNVHVLGIFDPSKNTQSINGVVGAVHYRATYGDSDGVAEDSAQQVVEEIIKCGGVAIPAHIDMPAGLGSVQSSHTVEQVCAKASAVEVVFPEGREEHDNAALKRYRSLNMSLPEVLGSDSHKPSAVGRSFTWVKMAVPTIEGLRLALIDGASSIKRSDKFEGDPNISSDSLILGLKVVGAKYCGRGREFSIRFNPWLNSIIGGRGSGKSSLLEFIRLGTGRRKDMLALPPGNEVRDSFDRFARKSEGRDDYGVLLDGTSVEVLYKKQGATYRLDWTFGSADVSISRMEGGVWTEEEGDAASRFPIKIFSQKQIFDLAKNPNALLRLIDSSAEVDQLAWEMSRQEEVNTFLRINMQKRELQSRMANRNALAGQLADVNQKISAIEGSGHAQLLSKFQVASQNSKCISGKVEDYTLAIAEVYNLVEGQEFSPFTANEFVDDSPAAQEVRDKFAAVAEELELTKINILQLVSDAESKANELNLWLAGSAYTSGNKLVEDAYKALVEKLAAEGVQNPGIYQQLITQRDALQKNIAELDRLKEQVDLLQKQAQDSYERLIELRRDLTRRREKFLRRYVDGNKAIEMSIEPFADEAGLELEFRTIISKMDGTFSTDIFDIEKKTGILNSLNDSIVMEVGIDTEAVLNARLAKVHQFKVEFVKFKTGSVLGVQLGKRFIDFLGNLEPEVLNKVVAWFPGDKLVVKYNDGKRMKDISQGSAGQKAATVLSFLLSYGDEPLVLDQPEDDLDNGLITSLIVSKLQENKSVRQIIVVTHNPNIVVNGDSEYVVALQDRGQIEVTASGGLQDIDVRRNVCEIMEGGEAALLQRYRRMVNI